MALQYLDTIIAFVVILLGVSLLITTLNQMISALLGYRGTNLRWGLQTLLSTVEPKLKEQSKELLSRLLKHPIISDSAFSRFKDDTLLGRLSERWRLASAISTEDLIRGLRKLADSMQENDKPAADLIHKLLEAPDPELQKRAEMVQNALSGLKPQYAIEVDKLVQQLGTSAQTSVGQIDAWFNIAMKRASQRFALQMRIWTIVFAFMIAFGTHMDSLQILQQLWTSPGLRAGLVSAKEAIIGEASVVVSSERGVSQSGNTGVSPKILVDAMKRFIAGEKEVAVGIGTVPEFNSLGQAVQWLSDGLNVEEGRKKILIGEYEDLVLSELKERADNVTQELRKTGFEVRLPAHWYDLFYYKNLSNILGILMSAAFLSLGAPFWFNTLKNLSNLRTLVAPRQEEKQ